MLRFKNGSEATHSACVFALGGASYLERIVRLRGPEMFRAHQIEIVPFAPSNVGFQVEWSEAFLKEALRKPLKNVVLKSSKGEKRGDVLVTEYGLEGTPIYFVGETGKVIFDLKPDLTEAQMTEKCEKPQRKISRRYAGCKSISISMTSLWRFFITTPIRWR